MTSTINKQLWGEFTRGSQIARDQLLAEHLGLVHHVARQLSRTLAAKADLDEMVSAGTMGLMSALEGFDPNRGLAFSTFAAPRIRGAILDELRRQDHVPRSVRRKAREMAQARETLQRIFGRPPEDAEIAEHLGVDLPTLWRWEADVESAVHVPIDRQPGDNDGPGGALPVDLLADETHNDIEEIINHEQEVLLLRDAIVGLKEQERIVLSLYYFEDLKLHQIAVVLNLTESRVSQIRSKALSRLREQLRSMRSYVA
jgi:RNA polymerase sigma factor for flagellar operon FliA